MPNHINRFLSDHGNLLFGGSVDKRLATCAAEASKPSKSQGASSEISPTSNPGKMPQSN